MKILFICLLVSINNICCFANTHSKSKNEFTKRIAKSVDTFMIDGYSPYLLVNVYDFEKKVSTGTIIVNGSKVFIFIMKNYFDSIGVKFTTRKFRKTFKKIINNDMALNVHSWQIRDLCLYARAGSLNDLPLNCGNISDSFYCQLKQSSTAEIRKKYFNQNKRYTGKLRNEDFNALVKFFFDNFILINYFEELGYDELE
ncbi:MAG: hypothetical protein RJA07_1635 [Bacteroidota bacterium]|jgi:hypothetical protein